MNMQEAEALTTTLFNKLDQAHPHLRNDTSTLERWKFMLTWEFVSDSVNERYIFTRDSMLAEKYLFVFNVPEIPAGLSITGYLNSLNQKEAALGLFPELKGNDKVLDGLEFGDFSLIDVADEAAQSSGQNFLPITISSLPDAGLMLHGLEDNHLDFIMGLYVASFARAPEYNGLEYWSGVLAEKLATGQVFEEAIFEIAQGFYESGAANGEAGTESNAIEFITSSYQILLARDPDQDGLNYWAELLESEQMPRSNFLVPFIDAALSNGGDGDQLTRLIKTSEFMAQPHVSGDANGIDLTLLTSIGSIENNRDALSIIDKVVNLYGEAESNALELAGVHQVLDA